MESHFSNFPSDCEAGMDQPGTPQQQQQTNPPLGMATQCPTPMSAAPSATMKRGYEESSEDRPTKMARPLFPPTPHSTFDPFRQLQLRNRELEEINRELISMYRDEVKDLREIMGHAKDDLILGRNHEARLQGELDLIKAPKRAPAKRKALKKAEDRNLELEEELEEAKLEIDRLKQANEKAQRDSLGEARNKIEGLEMQNSAMSQFIASQQPVATQQEFDNGDSMSQAIDQTLMEFQNTMPDSTNTMAASLNDMPGTSMNDMSASVNMNNMPEFTMPDSVNDMSVSMDQFNGAPFYPQMDGYQQNFGPVDPQTVWQPAPVPDQSHQNGYGFGALPGFD
ncbi:hypothetical protein K449DRAFT_419718 [Hypoxylon sp. EC38]|nr:hypothetical protein K449DRAFT_419718 [Hypoxylon sp. EC38]